MATGQSASVAEANGNVNGPEDEGLDWSAIDWSVHEDSVGRLRQRIFKATKDGDLKKVRSLQKLMLRNWSNTWYMTAHRTSLGTKKVQFYMTSDSFILTPSAPG